MFFEDKNSSPKSLWEDNFDDDNEIGDPSSPVEPDKDGDWDEIDIETDEEGFGSDEDSGEGEEE